MAQGPLTAAPVALKIEFACVNFFSIPLAKCEIETSPYTGRVYFVHKDKVVAVGRSTETEN